MQSFPAALLLSLEAGLHTAMEIQATVIQREKAQRKLILTLQDVHFLLSNKFALSMHAHRADSRPCGRNIKMRVKSCPIAYSGTLG